MGISLFGFMTSHHCFLLLLLLLTRPIRHPNSMPLSQSSTITKQKVQIPMPTVASTKISL